ncbi:deoxynucleoside kinase [Fundicoccus ignavus]|uniref:Deoxynucleoside kinase n=1 Tax=Fundicoccus ignavus TaxID=2664442 RepID=A0A6I2GG49_9LACT|nr:deoxynucleoside kinase [Fundicoccus ignavus]MRI80558.1 deoxynucleoside kinase [Fundicoccus ignavus]MRI84792.1 deoxynucleoside kinase [Fundicoccus ignavus]MRJ46580.1 deoxynucleoside kinase [Fundicoccus ignavus]
MAIIVIGGMIGAGKTSVAELVANALGTEVFYENVDDNDILPLFYTASEEEQEAKRYPFLLQLEFLSSRFKNIKDALINQNNVLDRSIYEDWYFCKINNKLGRISDTEFKIYEKLLNNMMEELEELPKKSPDLMVYLTGSFDTILHRIGLRGREFEQDQGLMDYYHTLWSGYDDWVENYYHASQVLVINIDEFDVVNRPEDADRLIKMVENKLVEMNIETSVY